MANKQKPGELSIGLGYNIVYKTQRALQSLEGYESYAVNKFANIDIISGAYTSYLTYLDFFTFYLRLFSNITQHTLWRMPYFQKLFGGLVALLIY